MRFRHDFWDKTGYYKKTVWMLFINMKNITKFLEKWGL